MSADYRVQRLSLPASLEAPGAAAFLEFCGLADEVQRQIWGHEDRCSPAAYRLRAWRDSAYESTAFFYVRDGGRMVGRAWCRVPLQEDLGRAQVRAEVLEGHTGRGIGRLLLAAAVEEARRRGRTVLDTYTEHPLARPLTLPTLPAAAAAPDGVVPDAVVPSTGTGTVPGGDRSVRFAQAAGFALSQVTRFSELVLDEHEASWPALEAAAADKAGPDYEVLLWECVPPEHRAAMAELFGRMSIDAPQGEDAYEPERWDADRVAALDRMLFEAGTVPLYAVARHRGTGELAAYTALWVREGKEDVGDQDDTLVRLGHRGRSLGMLIKLANLRAYRARFPRAAKVVTFNAAENEHMLAINTALGFRPAGADGEWYRRLA
ncbi:GNAT family N-acetyltransferase [Sinomonas mesophila]|uniref:GNAT family N-acetyltransferase n=1 Tax=Sinomonas mesophila TaxID=1531955 RepID=UPI0009874679|nr:GNAT family N-acetyltransferase [Sinomonas mesophila]